MIAYLDRSPFFWLVESYVRLQTKTETKPMLEINVGANLMFALRTKTGIKPMFENELDTFASDIGSQTIVVQRANIRFAPTLVLDIGYYDLPENL
jgi:hypothetical protein